MVHAINIKLPTSEYQVYIGLNILNDIGNILYNKKILIISNPLIYNLYRDAVTGSLKSAHIDRFLMEDGEKYKNLDTASRIYDYLIDNNYNRDACIVALGGGVVGDVAGFVASTYMRGIQYVHIPTTLLAQVDSSIGGKVGLNHPRAKNAIGSFYQPQFVYSDIITLKTLPDEEFENGMAEVIKYALIKDGGLFEMLSMNDKKSIRNEGILVNIVRTCAQIKASIVEKDEKERDIRKILNFGHTAGHALESASGYAIKHGRAVSIGIVVAADLSVRKGLIRKEDKVRILTLLEKYGLPTAINKVDIREIYNIMKHDKKIYDNKMQFILLNSIGNAAIYEDISSEMFFESLSNVFM